LDYWVAISGWDESLEPCQLVKLQFTGSDEQSLCHLDKKQKITIFHHKSWLWWLSENVNCVEFLLGA
tara:strand:+ start:48 stop:248 length:201 start_codon:yes stop_codon:yes gene_type:complete